MQNSISFIPIGSARMEKEGGTLRFTVLSSPPANFRQKLAKTRSYIQAEGLYRLPLRIDMTVALSAPGLAVMLGDWGILSFATPWDDNRRVRDLVEPPASGEKPATFANQLPLHTPVDISIVYNLKSLQILVDGQQRYLSTKERYMKSREFSARNAQGLALRLSCYKHTGVLLHALTVTQAEDDFPIDAQEISPQPILSNMALQPGEKPTFDAAIANLPEDLRARVREMDACLRMYKPIRFRRSIEKNGNKITYLASDAGLSYMINLSRDTLTHTLEWYLRFNSRDTWGTRKADRLEATLQTLALADPPFAARTFARLRDCCGCYGPGCMARSPYLFAGKTTQSCHGKLVFGMALSEFDEALRVVEAIEAG